MKKIPITSIPIPSPEKCSTVFNVVTGFLTQDGGDVKYKNSSLTDLQPWRIARLGMSRTFQDLRLFRRMSVLENVLLGIQNQKGEHFLNVLFSFTPKSLDHQSKVAKADHLLDFVGLLDHRNELSENLSYGQQKLLSIACCLATDPDILLLDEPVAGVQPAMAEKIESVLKHLVQEQSKTVFLIEHNIDFVLRVSDLVVVMDDGEKIEEGVPQGNRVFTELTVQENLEMGGYLMRTKDDVSKAIDFTLQLFPDLKERLRQDAAKLSGGEKQQLALARALMLRPRLLLMDEPSLGLAPKLVTSALDTIVRINQNLRTTIVIVEQKVHEVLQIAHRVLALRMGEVAFDGKPDMLADPTALRKIFLL